MTLVGLLGHPRGIVAEMKASDHWSAICELVDHLIGIEVVPQELRKSILASFREREDQYTTGIGGGKAVPHIYSEDFEEIVAVFGRSPKGIEFGAIDNGPVFIFVLLIVPKSQQTMHVKTLAVIARSLRQAKVYRALKAATDAGEILEILSGVDPGAD